MNFICTWILILLSLLGICYHSVAINDSVGKVVIGKPGTNVTSLTFSNNTLHSDKWFFHVFLTVPNKASQVNDSNVTISCSQTTRWAGHSIADFDPVTVEANFSGALPIFRIVTISCSQTTRWAGYSIADFDPVTVEANFSGGSPTFRIDFKNAVVGRAVKLRCWGQSLEERDATPLFTKDSSTSPPVMFAIYREGSVNICAHRVLVPYNYFPTDNRDKFLLKLSDPVEAGTEVLITCKMKPLNSSDANDVMMLQIEYPVKIPEGNTRIEVAYQRLNGSGPLMVACFGESTPVNPNRSQQYMNETSQGGDVLFELDRGYVAIYPDSTTLMATRVKLFLVLDAPVTSEVYFSCHAVTVLSPDHLLHIAVNPHCEGIADTTTTQLYANSTTNKVVTPKKTLSMPNQTGDWIVRNPSIKFALGGSSFAEVYLDHSSKVPKGGVSELLTVTCCVPSEQTVNPKYKGRSVAAQVITSLTPPVFVDLERATAPGEEVTESPIKNMAFVQLAPCPCDLIENVCDTNCCCDTACFEEDKNVFTCIRGMRGGFAAPPPKYFCETHDPVRQSDWHQFLCVYKENTAFLGYFFSNLPGLRDHPAFKVKAALTRPAYSYRETEERSKFSVAEQYKVGSDIKTGRLEKHKSTDKVFTRKNFLLSLPQKSLQGQCVDAAPLRFLRDVDNECSRLVTKELCSSMSTLSATTYAQSSELRNPPCPDVPSIIRAGRSNKRVQVKAFYLCKDDAVEYIHSNKTNSRLILKLGAEYFTIAIKIEDCAYISSTGVFSCREEPFTELLEKLPPSRCGWDDGLTPLPTPFYNEASGLCENVVVDVKYNFTWRGSELLLLNATYVLVDIPLAANTFNSSKPKQQPLPATPVSSNGKQSVLSQKFKVTFWREFVPQVNVTANETRRQGRYRRSGKIGYVVDRPLISGELVSNTTSDFLINQSHPTSLSLLSPAYGGHCTGAKQVAIGFREDSFSGCHMYMKSNNFDQGCDDLRMMVFDRQNYLMSASMISRNGDPDIANPNHWIRILREDTTAVLSDYPNTNGDTVRSREKKDVKPQELLVGTEFGKHCTNIASGIHLDILYAAAGKINGNPIYEIVGARINYTLSTWSLQCGSCLQNESSNIIQAFALTSSVNFYLVPSKDEIPLTRYELDHKPRLYKCSYETCWAEIAYPFLPNFHGDSIIYVRAMSLSSLLCIIGYFLVTRPWW